MDKSIRFVFSDPKYYKYIDYLCIFLVGVIVGLIIVYWQATKSTENLGDVHSTRVQTQTPIQQGGSSQTIIKEI